MEIVKHHSAHIIHIERKGVGVAHTSDIYINSLIDHLRRPDHCLETLDTPHAAALAVAGAWTPQADDVRHIKSVARNFPTFFADAFAAALKET